MFWRMFERKKVVIVSAEKHCYRDYENVIAVMTSKYGFEYTGLGDNMEECFHKQTDTHETCFIHPMFVHYYMAADKLWNSERLYDFNIETKFEAVYEQRKAFALLCNHLDKVAIITPPHLRSQQEVI